MICPEAEKIMVIVAHKQDQGGDKGSKKILLFC